MIKIYNLKRRSPQTKSGFGKWLFTSSLFVALLFALPSGAAIIQSIPQGGVWNSTNTWVGGVLPGNGDDVVIVDGAVVTMDIAASVRSLTIGQGISGILQWNSTANALTVSKNITINTGAKFLPYSSILTG